MAAKRFFKPGRSPAQPCAQIRDSSCRSHIKAKARLGLCKMTSRPFDPTPVLKESFGLCVVLGMKPGIRFRGPLWSAVVLPSNKDVV
jgi:hypothetical protein